MAGEAAPEAATMIVYNVSGMTCGGCATKVESAVTKLALPNVTGCTVDLENHRAVVSTTGDVDRTAIQNAITAAGFPAEPAPAAPAKS
jgi:copper chaperone CopZ